MRSPPKTGPGYEVAVDYCAKSNCNIIFRLRNDGPESGIEVKSRQGLALTEEEGVTQSEWSHVIISYDGSGRG